jgi:hypothetical protein
MHKLTLRHQVEIVILAVDNRPGGGISAAYTLARLNLHFATFLAILVAASSALAVIRRDIASLSTWLSSFLASWRLALQPGGWREDLQITWLAFLQLVGWPGSQVVW